VSRIAAALVAALLVLLAPAAAEGAGLAKTRKILRQQMAHAGAYSGAYVVDLDSGESLYAKNASVSRIPASVEKLFTSATALERFGPTGVLSTSALASAAPDDLGVIDGNLYLRGGGDPSFDAPDMTRLADLLVAAGLTEVTGRVVGDETAWDGLRGPPSSGFATSFDVGPLSALTYNRGFTGKRRPLFQASPPRFAAEAFTKALRRRGVTVRRAAGAGATPTAAVPLESVDSPTIAQLITSMNGPSDNFIAETLIKAVGARFGAGGTTSSGAAVVRSTIARFGIRTSAVDGSGLSRFNRTSPKAVVSLLAAMDESELSSVFSGSLPVAGRTGTLHDRMRGTAARDDCQAKTGTLSNVSALAGYCRTRDGGRVAFAFLMNYVWPDGARRLQDAMAAALARYSG
jgi:D-alanyl-D-alanine carboxypeptidase/D-alanyl-D-alanine-endopeptidase (penicillin-binding protein 4)